MPMSNRYKYEPEITWDKESEEYYNEDISDKEDNYEGQEDNFESYESKFQGTTRAMYSRPKDNEEVDRLNIQHYLIKYIWRSNFSAPIEHKLKGNARVLDVCCGAGTWLLEVSTDFPQSTFIGVDIATMYPSDVMPLNCEFIQCSPDEIKFVDNTFDFVHMRLTFAFIDSELFDKTISQLMRVLKPGGMIEIMVLNIHKSNQGPTTKHLYNSLFSYMQENGFMSDFIIDRVKDHLTSTKQLKNIVQEEKLIPVGKWAGYGMSLEDLHNTWPSVRTPLSAHMGISLESFDELVNRYVNEIDEFKTYLNTARIYATKN